MRKAALIGSVVFSLAAAGSVFAVSVGAAAPPPGLQAAIERTASAPSRQYAFTVRITGASCRSCARVQGQQSGGDLRPPEAARSETQNGMLQAAATSATLLSPVSMSKLRSASLSPARCCGCGRASPISRRTL
jgi:hypothetical protein